MIRNYVNVELFHEADSNQKDCLGWITIMEKADDKPLRKFLRVSNLEQRQQIAEGVQEGYRYLERVGISHMDLKMENILLLDDTPKIIDYGVIEERSGRKSYREMGYSRRGSKYRNASSLCK